MVTCPHTLASEAGVEALRAGGSAVDAAIAASAVLAVVYPHMTSVGGDAFWLIHQARAGGVRFLDAGGAATVAATLDAFRARGLAEIPYRGVLPATVTVPGAVDGCLEAHAACGRPPRAGETVRNPDLARTLEAIAAAGRGEFYEGEVAAEIARWARERGGLATAADYRAQRAEWGAPLSVVYRGVTLFETPPPTQGLSVLQMLRLLEGFDLGALEYLGPDHVHLLIQAKQLAFHDRDRFLADPRFVDVPVARLLSDAYVAERRQLIDPARALPWDRVPDAGSL